MFVPLMQNIS